MNATIFDIQAGSQWVFALRIESAEADIFTAFISGLDKSVTFVQDGDRWRV